MSNDDLDDTERDLEGQPVPPERNTAGEIFVWSIFIGLVVIIVAGLTLAWIFAG